MKEKMTGMQGVEKKGGVRYKVLPIAALLYALGLPQEGSAKGLSGTDEKTTVMEITPQVEDKKDGTIDLGPLVRGTPVKDLDEGLRELDEDQKEPEITGPKGDEIKIPGEIVSEDEGLGEKKEPRISVFLTCNQKS